MKEFSVYSVSIINLLILAIYCWQLIKKQIKPALAMWVFFSIAVGISLLTYLKEGNYSMLDNILNTADFILVVTVSLAILIFGDKNIKFNKFDLGCLVSVSMIVIFWILTKKHLISNILVQLILVIAYLPVIKRMIIAKQNTESFPVWFLLMIAPVFSLLSSKGTLASIYAIRAIASSGILLFLMFRINFVNKKRIKIKNKS